MKNITKNIVLGLGVSLICLISIPASGADFETLSALDVQREVMAPASVSKQGTVVAQIELKISLPDYPQIGPILFSEKGEISYTVEGDSVTIGGQEIPHLMSELDMVPDSMKPLTLVVAVTSKTVEASNKKSNISITPVDFAVAVYKKKRGEITSGDKPSISAELKNVQIIVEKYDGKNNSVELSFAAELPKTGDDLFDSVLAGKAVRGDYHIEF